MAIPIPLGHSAVLKGTAELLGINAVSTSAVQWPPQCEDRVGHKFLRHGERCECITAGCCRLGPCSACPSVQRWPLQPTACALPAVKTALPEQRMPSSRMKALEPKRPVGTTS